MSVPGRVQAVLGDEEEVARVPLGDDETLFTTPTRTLVHREGTFLRDESVDEFSNRIDRLSVNEGRRKTQITFGYDTADDRTLTIANRSLESALPSILTGVLVATNALEPGERVVQSYRFKELTVVISNRRLFKHVGAAVWDAEYEAFEYDRVTGVRAEEGSVATQIVLEFHDGTERLKVPQNASRSLREHLERAVCAFHGVDSIAALRAMAADAADEDSPDPEEATLADDIEPLSTGTDDAAEEDEFTATFEPPETVLSDADEELAALREAIEHQSELLKRQQAILERIERSLSANR